MTRARVAGDRTCPAGRGCRRRRGPGRRRGHRAGRWLAADLAYVIYTSGSTGSPRACWSSTGARRLHRDGARRSRRRRTTGCCNFAAGTFDVAAKEIFGPLTSGATLVLRSDELTTSARPLLAGAASQGMTVLDLPTAYLARGRRRSGATAGVAPGVRLVIFGGEALPSNAARVGPRRRGRPSRQHYGPTEATVVGAPCCDAGGRRRPPSIGRVPIGRRLAGTAAYVARRAGVARCRPGSPASCCLGGDGLARGYLAPPRADRRALRPRSPFAEPRPPGSTAPATSSAARPRRRARVPRPHRPPGQDPRLSASSSGEIEAALAAASGGRGRRW